MYIWNIKRKTVEIKNTDSKIAPLQDNNQLKVFILTLKTDYGYFAIMLYPFTIHSIKLLKNLDLNIVQKKHISINMDICELNNHYWLACYGTGIVELGNNYKIKNIYTRKMESTMRQFLKYLL